MTFTLIVLTLFTHVLVHTNAQFVLHTDGKNFDAARSDCLSKNGDLATPRDENENDKIKNLAANRVVWMGVNDIQNEGQWQDAQGNAIRWTKWSPGEPNNRASEDCVEMWRTGLWNDQDCSNSNAYVCRSNALVPPGGLVLHTHAKTFNDAKIDCSRGSRGVLATPRNANDNDQIRKIAGGRAVWIGVDDIAVEGEFKDVRGVAISWNNWRAGEPNNLNNEDCGVSESNSAGTWNDAPCGQTRAFVCRIYTEVGPYKDIPSARALKSGPQQYGYNAVSCHEACSAFQYFSLQNGGWCACENDFTQATQYGKSSCGKTGGGSCNYIYRNSGVPVVAVEPVEYAAFQKIYFGVGLGVFLIVGGSAIYLKNRFTGDYEPISDMV